MYTGVIYCAISPSHKKYYGQTFCDFESRKRRHFVEAIRRNCQYAFHRAIRKYKFDNFIWKIIEEYKFEKEFDLIKTLNERETYWIEKDKTYLPEFGYNMKIGGFNGRHNQETKDKIRKTLTGVKHTKERRLNNSNAHIGQTPWNKNKKCKQLSGKNNGMHGKTVYDLWVEKYGIEEANKRKELRRIKLSKSLQGKNKGKTYDKKMRLVREHINEKFSDESDPIHDLGIGKIYIDDLYKNWKIGHEKDISWINYLREILVGKTITFTRVNNQEYTRTIKKVNLSKFNKDYHNIFLKFPGSDYTAQENFQIDVKKPIQLR